MNEDGFEDLEPTPFAGDSRFPERHNVMPMIGDETLTAREVNFPMVQPPQFDGYENNDFRPQRGDAYDEVMLKGDIKRRQDDDFTEQTGWIYWRRIGGGSSSDSSSISVSSSSAPSSSSSGSSSDSSADDSAASSSKSTCIITVPTWFRETGRAALFNLECPEVRFLDWAFDVDLVARVTKVPIEFGYNHVCDDGTIRVYSVQSRKPESFGAYIDGDYIVIDSGLFWRWKSKKVTVSLTAVRDGFSTNPTDDPFFDPRMPERTVEQQVLNENKVNEAYDQVGKQRRPS